MDAYEIFGCAGLGALAFLLLVAGIIETWKYRDVYELLDHARACFREAHIRLEADYPHIRAPTFCTKCDSDIAMARERAAQRERSEPASEDAGAGPSSFADLEDEEDAPRRNGRPRSRSPYETRSRHPTRLRKRAQ